MLPKVGMGLAATRKGLGIGGNLCADPSNGRMAAARLPFGLCADALDSRIHDETGAEMSRTRLG